MAIYGYGRVSRSTQTAENQKLLIETKLGMPVDEWYEDHAVSGTVKTSDRPLFSQMIAKAVKGDTLVFSRVDRIARKTSDVLTAVESLLSKGIEVYILQIGRVPLSDASGMLQLTIYAMFAENERLSIVERTKNGLARTRANGTILGARYKIPPETLEEMMYDRDTLTVISKRYGFDRTTISRNLIKWRDRLQEYKKLWDAMQAQYSLT